MSGDRSKTRIDELQAELNRAALVDIGKRLAELEKKFWDLERETEDLKYFSEKTLATAKRLQTSAAKVLQNIRGKKLSLSDKPLDTKPTVEKTSPNKKHDPRED